MKFKEMSLPRNHDPVTCCEKFHEGTIFFLPNYTVSPSRRKCESDHGREDRTRDSDVNIDCLV